MAFKSVLSVVSPDQGEADVDMAAEACATVGAHLSVLVLGLAAPVPFEMVIAEGNPWLEQREEEMSRLAEKAGDFARRLSRKDVSVDVGQEYQDASLAGNAVGLHARYADVTMLGPDLLANATYRKRAVAGALFASGKPLLLVPAGSRPTLRPARVTIAWNGKVEAVRAVRESLEMLAAAEEVRVVVVDAEPGDGRHGEEPGADVATYLARHGAKVTVDRVSSLGRTVAGTLAREAMDNCADLLVMGGYGHTRVREWLFGGVTQDLTDNPPVPILMAR